MKENIGWYKKIKLTGSSPLMTTIKTGNEQIVEDLIKRKVKLDTIQDQNQLHDSVFLICLKNKWYSLCHYLIRNNIKLPKEKGYEYSWIK